MVLPFIAIFCVIYVHPLNFSNIYEYYQATVYNIYAHFISHCEEECE